MATSIFSIFDRTRLRYGRTAWPDLGLHRKLKMAAIKSEVEITLELKELAYLSRAWSNIRGSCWIRVTISFLSIVSYFLWVWQSAGLSSGSRTRHFASDVELLSYKFSSWSAAMKAILPSTRRRMNICKHCIMTDEYEEHTTCGVRWHVVQ